MPDELLQRLRRFHDDYFPTVQGQFRSLVREGQHPNILFIGCSDSRLLPYQLTGTGPGEVFMIRNVAAFVPPGGGCIEATAARRARGLHLICNKLTAPSA